MKKGTVIYRRNAEEHSITTQFPGHDPLVADLSGLDHRGERAVKEQFVAWWKKENGIKE